MACYSGDDSTAEYPEQGVVDIFIVADDDKTARAAYDRVLQHFCAERDEQHFDHQELLVVRSPFAVTFHAGEQERFVQVILRRNSCIGDVIFFGFDVDCCQIAWDGKRVLATPSAQRAILTGINVADPERRSERYEDRLR